MAGFLIAGGVLCLIALVLLLVATAQRRKERDVRRVGSGTVGDLRRLLAAVRSEVSGSYFAEPAAVTGTVTPNQHLETPFTHQPCLYFKATIVREYEEPVVTKDSQGRETRHIERRTETVSDQMHAVSFTITDATGAITVQPEGAEWVTGGHTYEDFRPPEAFGEEGHGGLVRALSHLNGRRTLGYRYTETAVLTGARLSVIAEASDRSGELTLARPEEHGRFIISTRSREQLLRGYRTTIKWLTISGTVAVVIGAILLLVGVVTAFI